MAGAAFEATRWQAHHRADVASADLHALAMCLIVPDAGLERHAGSSALASWHGRGCRTCGGCYFSPSSGTPAGDEEGHEVKLCPRPYKLQSLSWAEYVQRQTVGAGTVHGQLQWSRCHRPPPQSYRPREWFKSRGFWHFDLTRDRDGNAKGHGKQLHP